MMNMACTLFRLTPAEALLGVTRHAARALGLRRAPARSKPGKRADLCLWDVDQPGRAGLCDRREPATRPLPERPRACRFSTGCTLARARSGAIGEGRAASSM